MIDSLARGRDRARLLAEAIGAISDVNPEEILGRRRFKAIVVARHQLFVDLWRDGYSIADVGRILGFDHTSVIHGLRSALGDDVYEREVARR